MMRKRCGWFGIAILLEEGGEWPSWYGYAYRSFSGYRAVVYPIPINFVMQAVRWVWLLCKNGIVWFTKREKLYTVKDLATQRQSIGSSYELKIASLEVELAKMKIDQAS
jgi:hypothetical protein